jgi:hypothetical protein
MSKTTRTNVESMFIKIKTYIKSFIDQVYLVWIQEDIGFILSRPCTDQTADKQ